MVKISEQLTNTGGNTTIGQYLGKCLPKFYTCWLSANHDQQTMVGILLIDQRMLQNLIDLFRSVQTLEDIAKVIGNDKAMVVRCGEKCTWEVYTMFP